jgi:hypothetical protein
MGDRFYDLPELWIERAISEIEKDFQHRANVDAYSIALLNNVIRQVNGNPPIDFVELMPYKMAETSREKSKWLVSKSTAQAILSCHYDGLLPEWVLASVAKYFPEWQKLVKQK